VKVEIERNQKSGEYREISHTRGNQLPQQDQNNTTAHNKHSLSNKAHTPTLLDRNTLHSIGG